MSGPIEHDLVAIPATSCELGLSEDALEARVAEISAISARQIADAHEDAHQADLRGMFGPSEHELAPSRAERVRTLLRTWIPRRTVHVEAFAVDRARVTNQQYEVFARETGARTTSAWRGGRIVRGWERHPVEVTHPEAFAYATWAGLDMITDDEWQIAAGAEDGRRYPWGDEVPSLVEAIRHLDVSSDAGAYPELASPYGVLDMSLRAWEWCYGALRALPGGDEASFRAAFPFAERESWRALRGGHSYEQQSEILARSGAAPSGPRRYAFRCVRRVDTLSRDESPRIPEIATAGLADQPTSVAGATDVGCATTPELRPEERDRWIELLRTDVAAFNAARAAVGRRDRVDLRGADLRGRDLRRAHIGSCDLTGADLRGARVSTITLAMSRLEHVTLDGIEADRENRLADIHLLAALWRDVAWFNAHRPKIWIALCADLSGVRPHGADLSGARLAQSRLDHADLSHAKLDRTDFFECDLREARFSGNVLAFTELKCATLDGASFVNAELRLVSFLRASMRRARFQYARLERCWLSGTDARASSFACASLVGTKLEDADLEHASFCGASFEDVSIAHSRLAGADLRELQGEPGLVGATGGPAPSQALHPPREAAAMAIAAALARLRAVEIPERGHFAPRTERFTIERPDVEEVVLTVREASPGILADPDSPRARVLDLEIRVPSGDSSKSLVQGSSAAIRDALRHEHDTATRILESIEAGVASLRQWR